MTDLSPRATIAPRIALSDYRAPVWQIRHVELAFELDFAHTIVTASLHLQPDETRDATTPIEALQLAGSELELLDIALDGRRLVAGEYTHDRHGLRIAVPARGCVLRTQVRIVPDGNTRLEGLFRSGDALFTQCEAEGFRRITFFIDRPDVMPTWQVVLRADAKRFPVLLGNGNPLSQRTLDAGRHEAVWHNPHPTPSYLFALVAGDLRCVGKDIVTAEGRNVRLQAWACAHDVERCRFALEAIERALRWDEQRFGRCYDLDVFNIVAAQDFTMGAMENKGLNIFNARYILADEQTATDADYLAIESVIGHEYFHNWSGNRVTLRDWFQLALKEGLTVFRDQEFVSDLHSRQVKRIEDVRLLRSRQFAEDAGALAHPVRPPDYREINNFYTLTVYEKGAEIVRMLHTLLGERTFRAGMDRYFADNDGRAATIEDFLAAHAATAVRDLGQFMRWYTQSGTPIVEIQTRFDSDARTLTMDIRQRTPPTAAQPDPQPLHIPLRFALHGQDGSALAARASGDVRVHDELIELTQAQHRVVFDGIDAEPLASFNHGFSVPARIVHAYSADQLAQLARIESDPFLRWEFLQQLALGVLLQRFGETENVEHGLLAALDDLLADAAADPAFVAECMQLPDFDTLFDQMSSTAQAVDIDGLLERRERLLHSLATHSRQRLRDRYDALADTAALGLDATAISARQLRNACLTWLTRIDPRAELASRQFAAAAGMTDRLAALRCLIHGNAPSAETALETFRSQYRDNPLVTDKWIAVVATRPHVDALEDVRDLLASKQWWLGTNPNRVRAVLGSFSRANPTAFHRADGAGYRLLVEQLSALDAINPQVAARLLSGFESWRRWSGARGDHAAAALHSLHGKLASPDSIDLLSRLLA